MAQKRISRFPLNEKFSRLSGLSRHVPNYGQKEGHIFVVSPNNDKFLKKCISFCYFCLRLTTFTAKKCLLLLSKIAELSTIWQQGTLQPPFSLRVPCVLEGGRWGHGGGMAARPQHVHGEPEAGPFGTAGPLSPRGS